MKKLLLLFIAIMTVGILSACGNNTSENEDITTDDVISAFKDAGLEVGETSEMTKDDFGLGPMKSEEGIRFLIPSLGENNGGRILTYKNESDLDEMKEYYDSLGEESAMFFSWTIKHKNVLVQINGDLPEEKYEEYKKALESL
ncbi:stress protein [Gracilibacillus marinus]|uniref:Stress protein n=1 Tax=Gracilibacillus marinus TaxID=630535 RepID=A0ABV8VXJ5_9BACI